MSGMGNGKFMAVGLESCRASLITRHKWFLQWSKALCSVYYF